MRVVWKYQFAVNDEVRLLLPESHQIVHVETQQAIPTLWVLVDPDSPDSMRTFYVRGTGHPVEDGLEHVGTFISGSFVWHVFTKPEVQR